MLSQCLVRITYGYFISIKPAKFATKIIKKEGSMSRHSYSKDRKGIEKDNLAKRKVSEILASELARGQMTAVNNFNDTTFVTGNSAVFSYAARNNIPTGKWVLQYNSETINDDWTKIIEAVKNNCLQSVKITGVDTTGQYPFQTITIHTIATSKYISETLDYLVTTLGIDQSNVRGYKLDAVTLKTQQAGKSVEEYHIDCQDKKFYQFKEILKLKYEQDRNSLFGKFRKSRMLQKIENFEIGNLNDARLYANKCSGLLFSSRSQKILKELDKSVGEKYALLHCK